MSSAARPATLPAAAGLLLPRLQTEPFAVRPVQPSPCAVACPAGINVKSYVSLIAEGRFGEALEVVRERCPLPGVCGRICHHPCETACRRGECDQPVAIRALKRFVADLELELPPPPAVPIDKTERVAIVGSGPAGLTAAYDLRRAGYAVTVFEAESEAGGMLRYGIADYRLPVDVLAAEIAAIEHAGVEIETGRRIGVDRPLGELSDEFDALILAVGAQRGRRLRLRGEESCAEVEDALAFLRRVNEGDRSPVAGKVLVIGGGSTAIEAARVALRLGAERVEIVYRRRRAEMPADDEEIDVAAAEGVGFRYLAAPQRVRVRDGTLESLECLEVALGEEDASGRRRPIPLPGSEFSIAADRIFAAVGQEAVLDFLPAELAEQLVAAGVVATDPLTSATARPGIFAAGDVAGGPASVIDAIAAGHRAAGSVRQFLERGTVSPPPRHEPERLTEYEIPLPPPALRSRRRPPHAEIRAGDDFAEVERAFSPADAVAEAGRCMRCGPCGECLICAPSCGRRHLSVRPMEERALSILLRAPAHVAAALAPGAGGAASAQGWILSDPLARGAAIDPALDCAVALAPTRVTIDPDRCRGCARCLEVCGFDALRLVDPSAPESVVEVDAAACRGCNLCAGICPTDAVAPSAVTPGWWGTRLEDVYPRLAAGSERAPLVVLACQRRAAAVERTLAQGRGAGAAALLVPVRCAGQVPAGRLLEIHRRGAGAIVVAGCLGGSCRYDRGTSLAMRQLEIAGDALVAMGRSGHLLAGDWAGEDDAGLDLERLDSLAAAPPARPSPTHDRRPQA